MEDPKSLVPKNPDNAFVPGVVFGVVLACLMGYVRKHRSKTRHIIDATYDVELRPKK